MRSEPLYLFVHIPKTAGESFKRNMELSLKKGQFLRTSFSYNEPFFNIHTKKEDFLTDREYFIRYIQAFTPSQKDHIRCLGGHDTFNGMDCLFNRPYRYITFLREPTARTLSLYNFERMAYALYSPRKILSSFERQFLDRIERCFLIADTIPSFKEWLEHVYNKKHPFYYSMTHYLQLLGFLDQAADSDSLLKCLTNFYFVGTDRTYSEDVLFLYDALKVNYFEADSNASTPFITLEMLDKKTVEKLHEINASDYLLYQLALEQNCHFKHNVPHFKSSVQNMQKKKSRQQRRKKITKPFSLLLTKVTAWAKKILKKSPWLKRIVKGRRKSRNA